MTAAPSSREEVDARVDHIAGLMAAAEWVTRKSARGLALKWGVSERTVREYAKQASRIVRADRGDIDEIRETTLSRLEVIADHAHGAGEYGDAVRALGAIADITGINAPQKLEVKHSVDSVDCADVIEALTIAAEHATTWPAEERRLLAGKLREWAQNLEALEAPALSA